MEFVKTMESRAIAWLRFQKQNHIVCTESPTVSNADVMGWNGKTLTEIEIKRSKSDFKADFANKVKKHNDLNNIGKVTRWPHFFYFCVPEDLVSFALEYLEENGYSKYGLLTESRFNFLQVIKRPARLHNNKPTPIFIEKLVKRMSSELCNLHLNHARLITDTDYMEIKELIKSNLEPEGDSDEIMADNVQA